METKTRKRRKAFVEAESCMACGCCVKVCPREAIACRNWKHMTMQYLELSEYWEKLFQLFQGVSDILILEVYLDIIEQKSATK